MNTNAHQFQGQKSKVKVTRPIALDIYRTGRPTNFKIGTQMDHALSTAMASYRGL